MCGITKSNETTTAEEKKNTSQLPELRTTDDNRVCMCVQFPFLAITDSLVISILTPAPRLPYSSILCESQSPSQVFVIWVLWRLERRRKKIRKKQCKKAIITPMKHHRNDKENGGKKIRPVRSMIALLQRGNISRRVVWAECIVTTEYTSMLNICRHCSMPWPIKIIFMNLSLVPEPILMWRSAWEQRKKKTAEQKKNAWNGDCTVM